MRWACLLLDASAEQIAAINSRCKAPRECAELALLACQHCGAWQEALRLPAEALLALLQGFDVYRRPQRFEQFLAACEMAGRGAGQGHEFPQTAYLRGAADCVRGQVIQPLLEQGYQGAALGQALARQRLEALRTYRAAKH